MADTSVETSMGDRLGAKIARVDDALATPWWRARVGNGLDAHVEATTAANNVHTFRFWVAVLAGAQLLGLLRDAGFGMQNAGFMLRGMLVLPVLGLIVLVLGRRPSQTRAEGLTSLAVLTAVAAQILLALIGAQPFADRYLMGAVFAFSILHLVMPLSHRQIVAHAILVGGIVCLTAWISKSDGEASVTDRLELLLPAMIFVAAIGALVMRNGRRRAVLMDLRSALQAEALEHANRTLALMLRQDTLTGVFNRRYFDETMDRLWREAEAAGRPLGLILLDVDRFKSFNDHKGHQAGDLCLKEVAACLSAALRESDFVVARYGGEEFAAILPGVSAVDAHAIGERLRKAVEALAWPHPVGGVVTVSVGSAACVPDAGRRYFALVDAADSALYASKEAGRNRVTANFIAHEREKPVAQLPAQAA